MGRILIVDDEPHMHELLASSLEHDKHSIFHASRVEEAREAIATNPYEAILADPEIPGGGGREVLAAVREADPSVAVVFLTTVTMEEPPLESTTNGAFHILAKPFTREALRAVVQRACDHTTLVRQNQLLKAVVDQLEGSAEVLGETPVMQEVCEKIGRVAPMAVTVLITGEAGTGKESVARAIHRQSPRAAKSFLAVNCAAFTETQLESELFGHQRGVFRGADRNRPGLFELAQQGTLFLDEVAEMPAAIQAKLVRVLTDGQVMRMGSMKPITVDVRVLAATHRNLHERIKSGLFREDLYYRLAEVPIVVPPLRERTGDMASLCDLFLTQVALEMKVPKRRMSAAALAQLQTYDFPGNLRELRNLIERAMILSSGEEIESEHFPQARTAGAPKGPGGNGTTGHANLSWIEALPPSFDLRNLLSAVEKTVIERTLQATRGAQAEAARRLGLSRSDLSYKLLKYELRKETAAS